MTFTAFDCSSLNNITFLDHNETCTQRKSSLVKGMATLMTRDTVVKFPGFRCTGHRTSQYLYCGWDATESILQPDETYVLTQVSVDDCISMAVENRVQIGGKWHNLPRSGILHASFVQIGETMHHNAQVECQGQKIRLNGQLFSNVLIYTQLMYTVDKVELSHDVKASRNLKDLTNREEIVHCPAKSRACMTDRHTYVWTIAIEDTCTLKKLLTTEVSIDYNTREIISKKHKFHLIQKEKKEFQFCEDLGAFKTNHYNLYISFTKIAQNLQPSKNKESTDLSLFVTSRDEFLRYLIEKLENQNMHNMRNCQTDNEQNGLRKGPKRGTFIKSKGEASIMVSCKEVRVNFRKTAECYSQFPVISPSTGRTGFLTPKTRILSPISKSINCSQRLESLYIEKGKWYTAEDRQLVQIRGPSVRRKDEMESKEVLEEYNFESGINTARQLRALVNEIHESQFKTQAIMAYFDDMCRTCIDTTSTDQGSNFYSYNRYSPENTAERIYNKWQQEMVFSLKQKVVEIGAFCGLLLTMGLTIKLCIIICSFSCKVNRLHTNNMLTIDNLKNTEQNDIKLKLNDIITEMTKLQKITKTIMRNYAIIDKSNDSGNLLAFQTHSPDQTEHLDDGFIG